MKTLLFLLFIGFTSNAIPGDLPKAPQDSSKVKIVINHEMIKRFNECNTFDSTKTFRGMRAYLVSDTVTVEGMRKKRI